MSSPTLSSPAPRTTAPREPGRKDPALLLAHAAMASMLAHGLAPTPANYLVWFNFHGNATPGLTAAVDACLAEGAADGRGMTQPHMEELRQRFFAAEHEAQSLQEVAARLEAAVGEAVGLILDAREDALRYGGTLDMASSRLAKEPQSLGALLRLLVTETMEVSRRSEAAARSLTETSSKTQKLQTELAEARHLASTDPLTGLGNRRQLDDALRDDLAKQKPLAIVMLDIDHFKAVNDSHGHPAGDQVLCHLANILSETAGETALAARFGGEEFAVILPLCALREALGIAEKIRARIGDSSVLIGQTGHRVSVTASIGVAVAGLGETPAHLIQRVDAALYDAKRGGRNRVCSNPPPPKAESVWN